MGSGWDVRPVDDDGKARQNPRFRKFVYLLTCSPSESREQPVVGGDLPPILWIQSVPRIKSLKRPVPPQAQPPSHKSNSLVSIKPLIPSISSHLSFILMFQLPLFAKEETHGAHLQWTITLKSLNEQESLEQLN